jgi:hypothetical protein
MVSVRSATDSYHREIDFGLQGASVHDGSIVVIRTKKSAPVETEALQMD